MCFCFTVTTFEEKVNPLYASSLKGLKTQETFSLYLFIIYLFKDKSIEIVKSAYEVVDKPRKSIFYSI